MLKLHGNEFRYNDKSYNRALQNKRGKEAIYTFAGAEVGFSRQWPQSAPAALSTLTLHARRPVSKTAREEMHAWRAASQAPPLI